MKTQKLSDIICRDKNHMYTHYSFNIRTCKTSVSHLICHFHKSVITNLHSLFFPEIPQILCAR